MVKALVFGPTGFAILLNDLTFEMIDIYGIIRNEPTNH